MCARLTSTGQVAGQSLVVHEHLARGGGVGDGVLGSHVSTHNPEAATTQSINVKNETPIVNLLADIVQSCNCRNF